jgi:hypothetical protein
MHSARVRDFLNFGRAARGTGYELSLGLRLKIFEAGKPAFKAVFFLA